MVSKLEKQVRARYCSGIGTYVLGKRIHRKTGIPLNTCCVYLSARKFGFKSSAKYLKNRKIKRGMHPLSKTKYGSETKLNYISEEYTPEKNNQRKFEESIESKEPDYFLSIPDNQNDFAEQEQAEYLEFCLNQLTPIYRQTLEMRFFRNLTFMQIAEIEKVKYQAIEQRERKAIKKLREICGEYR